jgi:two-component system, sensor histidine kinase and response regulator
MPDILVVDDTPANLRLMIKILQEGGYTPVPAESGELALQAARSVPPELILLDVNMPEMDGYAVCERFKAEVALKDIPVIFLSALQETSHKVRAFQAGGVDYITKPFQPEEVLARVQTHLELRRQKRLSQENFEALTKLERLRDNLMHMVVHDMRSPLTTITGYLALLEKREATKLSASGLNFIHEARQSIDRLIDMVNSMLDLSRLEAGELTLNRSECDLGDLARPVLDGFEPLRGGRKWTLNPPAQPVKLNADAALISRVIQNLMANAIKFTSDDGSIRINISVTDHQARVTVADNGRGVPLPFQEKIFEKFGQLESADARTGTGLGLFFCKLVVELHGGRIGVESEMGKGSTFWLTLPLE